MNRLILLILLILIFSCSDKSSSTKSKKVIEGLKLVDSLLERSNDKTLDEITRFGVANQALEISEIKFNDSLKAKSLFQLIKLSYPLRVKDSFLKYYPKSLHFSKRIQDTFHIAQTHNYTAYFYQKNQSIDSAYLHYYHGSKYFKLLENNYQAGKMLLNMAIIQKNKRDFKGSEEVTKQALDHLLKTNELRYIASAFNNLGIVNNELGKLDVSIRYHKKALNLRKILKKNPILTVESYNNILVAYKNNGDHNTARSYYDSVKQYSNLLEDYPIVRARVLDNNAHNRLLSGSTKNVLRDMELALSIRRDENHLTGIMVSLLHLSEYYLVVKNSDKSFQYALDAKLLSQKHGNLRDVLEALEILTLNDKGLGNRDFIKEYYLTLEKLEKTENLVADEFARIRFEVDEKEKENTIAKKKVREQEQEIKNNKIVIALTIGIIFLLVFILYLIWKSSKYRKDLYIDFSHRTKHNFISIKRGVLKLKATDKNNPYVKELEASTESQLILHSLLEQSNYPTKVDLNEYFKILINTIVLIYPDYIVSKEFNLMNIKMNSKKASLIGKILTEFITNAFKHGFSNELKNSIEAVLKVSNKKEVNISVNVSGKKWNPKSDLGKGDGMLLMYNLSKKIPAELYISYRENKTTLNLKFKKTN